jgi:hypothetical protein
MSQLSQLVGFFAVWPPLDPGQFSVPTRHFSTAVLKIANSPVCFSEEHHERFAGIDVACFWRLCGVVMTVGRRTYRKDPFAPLLQSGWRHSVACAIDRQTNGQMEWIR